MTTQRKRTPQYLIALVATLAACGMTDAALAASTTATATATVLVPMTITKSADLNFGELVAGNGTVTLDTSGGRTKTGSTVLPSTGTITAARFDVTGDTTHVFSISYTGSSTVLTDGTAAHDMAVTWISEAAAASTGKSSGGTVSTGTLAGGALSIFVGASLVVDPAQVAGAYTGTIAVSVDYN